MMIKPDAVRRNLCGWILKTVEEAGLSIRQMRLIHLTPEAAKGFYHVHQGKPFLNDLVEYMSSGPIVVAVLEGEGAILGLRKIVGATDPAKAEPGTIRGEVGLNVQENSVHASDSEASAVSEIAYYGLDEIWRKP
ncbi:MAG: nucleoside-diphosphate kinase [Candidatus Eisenbacteria bacterium]|nr:nucleoside-diphosphate kinase [Candidatus Eisenbacteria bacterium]